MSEGSGRGRRDRSDAGEVAPYAQPRTSGYAGRRIPGEPHVAYGQSVRIVRGRTGRVLLVDGLIAAGLLVLTWGVSWRAAMGQVPPDHPLDPLAYILMTLAIVPLAVRRVWPVVTLGITIPAMAVFFAFSYPYGPVMLTILIAMYSVGARLPARPSLVACGMAAAALFFGHLFAVGPGSLAAQLLGMAGWASAVLLVPWAIGTLVRLHREDVVRTRGEEARRGRDEERLRMAREVHDVVGHSLAVINMQSGVALHVLDRRPDQARPALEAIKRTSKESLDELRSTLAVFRQPEDREDAAASRRPTPTLRQLDGLVSAMADSGLPVDLSVAGERADVPASVDLAAYRIAQESLTNVLRHAGDATAAVWVHYDPHEILLEITDNGTGQSGDGVGPGGHGIPGMRERAAAVGGTLEAGPRQEGGFCVRARLPLGEERT
ncbi:MAG: sensor histidine kinase [Streptosporangiaceae bacterium]